MNLAIAFYDELHKLAADSKAAAQPAQPMSPVEQENQQLAAMLENLQLKMQIRQQQQALAAMQQQDQMAQEQALSQGAQQAVMQGLPVVNAENPEAAGAAQTPNNPQEIVGS